MAMPRKKKSKMRAYGPVIGLVLAIAVGVLAWFLAPPVDDVLRRSLPNFREIPANNLRIFTAAVMFVVFVLLVSLIVAAAAPRKKSMVNEKEMHKSREELIKEKKMTKMRRQYMNRMNRGG